MPEKTRGVKDASVMIDSGAGFCGWRRIPKLGWPVNVNCLWIFAQMALETPVNKLPPTVIMLTLLIVGIELVLQLANLGVVGGPKGVGWRLMAMEEYAFSTRVFELTAVQQQWSFDLLKRYVTYPFINAELTQVAFCAALTLALGKFVGEYFGGLKVLVIYLFASIFGALIYGVIVSHNFPLFGGFTPVFGLIGAYTYALWLRLGQAGKNQLLAFRLIGVLLLIQLIFGLIFGSNSAWIAELAGFFAGFGIAILLAPGGWATFLARMRQRA